MRIRARTLLRLILVRIAIYGGVLLAMALLLRFGDFLESRVFYLPDARSFQTPSTYEDVWFENDSGLALHGWWMPAAGEAIGTVLYCHGNAGAIPDHLSFCAALPSRGFNVFLFDYRGYGQSDAPASPLKRQMLIEDATAALKTVLARPDVDPERVVVMGHSMGGMAASNLVAIRGEATRLRALALVSAFSSWSGVASDFVGPLGPLLIRDHNSPRDATGRIGSVPLMILHGEQDTVVRARHAPIIYESAKEKGVPAELVLVGDADHESILSISSNQQRVADFFERVLRSSD